MSEFWTPDEKRLLKKLNTPEKIQKYLDQLTYNCDNSALSPRWVMLTNEGHCFEGALMAAAAMEFHGEKPLLVDLVAHDDDHHILCVYKRKTGWGSISKTNSTILAGRMPYYRDIRELVMSYFDMYFTIKGRPSLMSYAGPINLNRYNSWNWRTTDEDLQEMGMGFSDLPHKQIISLRELKKQPKVAKRLIDGCFVGADPKGIFKS